MSLTNTFFSIDTKMGEEIRHSHGKNCMKYGEKSADVRQRFYVKRTVFGWVFHCKNCSYSGKRFYSPENIVELVRRGENLSEVVPNKEHVSTELEYPAKTSDLIPIVSHAWLGKYNITEDEIERFGIYHNYSSGQLILPIYNIVGDKIGFQARKMLTHDDMPKYITKFENNVDEKQFWNVPFEDHVLVIVEDIVSAIKVGRYANTVALLGSPDKLPDHVIRNIKGMDYKHIFVWLDPDKQLTALKIAHRLKETHNIEQARAVWWDGGDPKDADEMDILEMINGYTNPSV